MTTLPKKRDRGDEPNERSRLASRLREEREYLGFSQDEVAQHLGISRSALSNIETGQRKVEATELKRLATLFKKPLAYFTGEARPVDESLPEDVEHIAREASKLAPKDREELARFAAFLRSQSQDGSSTQGQ